MHITVIVTGKARAGHAIWAQALDQSTEDKVPFVDGRRDVCFGSGDAAEGASQTFELPDGADLVIYEEPEADAKEQDSYLRTGA